MSKLLFNEQPLVIDKKLATLIGLNEAMVLQQIHYWIEINRKADKNLQEEKYWTYNTIEEWQKEFPFWSVDTVKRTLNKLRKLNILITENFNKLKIDRTLWYTINYDELERLCGNEDKEEETIEIEPTEEPKPLETPKSAFCTNEEKPISAKSTNAIVHIAPMHQCNMHRPLPEISTETSSEISIQSISQSMSNDNIKIRTKKQIYRSNKLMDEYKQTIKYCEINHMEEEYRDAVKHAIKLLYLDIENKIRINIGDNIIPSEIVRNDLNKLNYLVIEHAINKFKEASGEREIRNTVAYLKACIYNSIHEMKLDVDSELRNKGLI